MSSRSSHKGLSPRWVLWLKWVLASSMGVAVVFALTYAIAMVVGAVLGGGAEDKVPFVPFVGLAVGIMQWLVLRRYIPQAGWWVLASTAGWLMGFGVLGIVAKVMESAASGPIEGEAGAAVFSLAAGASVGTLQWLILRRHIPRTGWWVLANVVGWVVLGLAVGKSLDRLADLVAVAAVPPAITGVVLVWLFRQPLADASSLGRRAV